LGSGEVALILDVPGLMGLIEHEKTWIKLPSKLFQSNDICSGVVGLFVSR
jgi:hypothetical protein